MRNENIKTEFVKGFNGERVAALLKYHEQLLKQLPYTAGNDTATNITIIGVVNELNKELGVDVVVVEPEDREAG